MWQFSLSDNDTKRTKARKAGEVALLGKGSTCKHDSQSSVCRKHGGKKDLDIVTHIGILVPRKQKPVDPWCFLAGQPSPLGKFQASEKPFHKNKVHGP